MPAQNSAGSTRRFTDGVSLPELVRFLREGLYIMDADGVILDANPVALDLLGFAAGADPAAPVIDAAREPAEWRHELDALARDGAVREFTREVRQPDGTTRTVLDTCYARVDDGVVTYHGIVIDVSVVPARDPGVAADAHARDPGTGAYTADYLNLLDTQRLHADLGVSVIRVLETTGVPAGSRGVVAGSIDQRLERMTRFLLRHIRSTEFVVRADDDTLVIVLPDADERATEIVGRRLQLAALRSAPSPFELGWATRTAGESVRATVARAVAHAVPVRVVERNFEPARKG